MHSIAPINSHNLAAGRMAHSIKTKSMLKQEGQYAINVLAFLSFKLSEYKTSIMTVSFAPTALFAH